MRMQHHIPYCRLTFFLSKRTDFLYVAVRVHEERTYEVLTYDILLEQAGFKSL